MWEKEQQQKQNKLVNFLRFRNRKFQWGRPWPWFVQNINLFQRSKPIRFCRKLKNELAYLTLQTRIHTKELPPKVSKRTGNAYHLKNGGPEWQVDVDAFNLKEGLDLDVSFTFNCYIRSFRSADLQGRLKVTGFNLAMRKKTGQMCLPYHLKILLSWNFPPNTFIFSYIFTVT